MRRTRAEIQREKNEASVLGVSMDVCTVLKLYNCGLRIEKLLTRSQAAQALNVSIPKFMRLLPDFIAMGLTVLRTGTNPHATYFFYEEEFKRFVNEYAVRVQQEKLDSVERKRAYRRQYYARRKLEKEATGEL